MDVADLVRARGVNGRPLCLAALALAWVACTSAPGREPPQRDPELRLTPALGAEIETLHAHLGASAEPTHRGLVVRIAFPARADMDVYVSDPLQETVYYANTPARSGGRLGHDATCRDRAASEPIRIEEIVFVSPPPGLYRAGVDFARACDDGGGPTPWAMRIERPDGVSEHSGLLLPRRFESIVEEFEIVE